MASIFTKIINREIPSYKIAEDSSFYAFLDINPLKKGHTLVVPKKEIDYLFDIDDEVIAAMMVFSKKVARGIEKVIDCERIGIAVLGLEVPHAHIHLIPVDDLTDTNFEKPKLKLSPEEFKDIADKISKAVIL